MNQFRNGTRAEVHHIVHCTLWVALKSSARTIAITVLATAPGREKNQLRKFHDCDSCDHSRRIATAQCCTEPHSFHVDVPLDCKHFFFASCCKIFDLMLLAVAIYSILLDTLTCMALEIWSQTICLHFMRENDSAGA